MTQLKCYRKLNFDSHYKFQQFTKDSKTKEKVFQIVKGNKKLNNLFFEK